MNQFQPSLPRAALAASAVALTAMVLGLSIIVPANLATGDPALRAAAAARIVLPGASETAIGPGQAAWDGPEDQGVIHVHAASAPTAAAVADASGPGQGAVVPVRCPHARDKGAHVHST